MLAAQGIVWRFVWECLREGRILPMSLEGSSHWQAFKWEKPCFSLWSAAERSVRSV